jgi:hypothetical protein
MYGQHPNPYFKLTTNSDKNLNIFYGESLSTLYPSTRGNNHDKPFKALIFKPRYQSKGSNNQYFLAVTFHITQKGPLAICDLR